MESNFRILTVPTHCLKIKTEIAVQWSKTLVAMAPQTNLQTFSSGNLADIIHTLDDDSVRKIFGMGPKLTEAELEEIARERRMIGQAGL